MTFFSELLATVLERRPRPPSLSPVDSLSIDDLTAGLLSAPGEEASLKIARKILGLYETMNDDAKLAFFTMLAVRMNISPDTVRLALDRYEANAGRASYKAFMAAAEPPRQEFMRRLNQVSGGSGALVRMRADLLRFASDEPALQALDLDFQHLFVSWFNRGFVVLRPINWESPANILEKIIAYEAVHQISSWDDLRRRLEPVDRRCFAFFHPAMPTEPLIFVEVALTQGIPGSIQDLLGKDRIPISEGNADTAVFYSISNCQKGLVGISFGNSLIKQVASHLGAEHRRLKTFVTLSPVPGLARWLKSQGIEYDCEDDQQMRTLAANYLLNAKKSDGAPVDPVERFHLGNGASLHQVHARADISEKGIAESGGVMVNYLYDLARVEQNHERFSATKTVLASSEIKSLCRAAERATT